MMRREVATEWPDRPHAFKTMTTPRHTEDPMCGCGRRLDDPLHEQQARELAEQPGSGTPVLQSEKGS